MEVKICGIGTPHAPGVFGKRLISSCWFFTCFYTDFLYEKDGTLLPGHAGDFLIIPPETPVYHGPTQEMESGFVNDWIYFSSSDVPGLLQRYPLPLCLPFAAEGMQASFRRYLQSVKQEQAGSLPGAEDRRLFLTGQLVIDLYRSLQQETTDAGSRLDRLRDAVMLEPENPWTLESMAELCGYSVSRFSALYRQRYGISPIQDLLTARLDKAAKLLKYTGLSVSQVAEACGFGSIHYFSKYFKAARGLSPKDYAQQA